MLIFLFPLFCLKVIIFIPLSTTSFKYFDNYSLTYLINVYSLEIYFHYRCSNVGWILNVTKLSMSWINVNNWHHSSIFPCVRSATIKIRSYPFDWTRCFIGTWKQLFMIRNKCLQYIDEPIENPRFLPRKIWHSYLWDHEMNRLHLCY